MFELKAEIRKWRDHLRTTSRVSARDMEELESHLRDSVDDLTQRGLSEEEAFLLSVKRLGSEREMAAFADVPAEQVWRQLIVLDESAGGRRRGRELAVVFALAALAVALSKIPLVLGAPFQNEPVRYLVNSALFVFPSVTIYMGWKRGLRWKYFALAAVVVAVSAVLLNVYPSVSPGNTRLLSAIHAPIFLWLCVGVLYAGPGFRRSDLRLDFVRFSGEVFIYSVLIILGMIVLAGTVQLMFGFVAIDTSSFVSEWIAAGLVYATPVVATFLVERKKSVIESMAPILARIFTPLFFLTIIALLIAMAATGLSLQTDRELLIGFDLLLAVVLGLVLYTMSSRDPGSASGIWDVLVLALVAAALLADVVALVAIARRLAEFGVSANKTAALGENVLLVVNLSLLAVGYIRFLGGRAEYHRIVRLQMQYLPVYAAWAAFVAFVFPPLFGWR